MRLDDVIAQLRDESALWDALSTAGGDEAEAVRTVFAWSYRALSPDAARLFRLLGCHPGPDFALGAATALAGRDANTTRHLLDTLVEAHLLEQTAPDRYEFHDLLRAYAAERARHEEPAEERESARHRVLHWYLLTADAAQSWISPADDRVPLPPPPDGVSPTAFTGNDLRLLSDIQREQGRTEEALRSAEEAKNIAPALRDHTLEAYWFLTLGDAQQAADMTGEALISYQRAATLHRRLGDRSREAMAWHGAGETYRRLEQHAEAAHFHRLAADTHRELGDPWHEATARDGLALCLLAQDDPAAAREQWHEAVRLLADYDDPRAAALRRHIERKVP